MPASHSEYRRAAYQELTGDTPRAAREALRGARAGWGQAPTIGGIAQGYGGLEQERLALMQQLGGLGQITSASPFMQDLARQAAFAPLEALNFPLQQAMLQASNAAQSRGLGQSSIAAAMQAQTIPAIMGPAMAQAQGQYAQNLLQLPYMERGQRLQEIGMGGELGQLGAGYLQGQTGLRESAFAQLQGAYSMASAEREYQSQARAAAPGRRIAGLGGALLGVGLGAMLPGIGGAIGGMFGAGGASMGRAAGTAMGGVLNPSTASPTTSSGGTTYNFNINSGRGYGSYGIPGQTTNPWGVYSGGPMGR